LYSAYYRKKEHRPVLCAKVKNKNKKITVKPKNWTKIDKLV